MRMNANLYFHDAERLQPIFETRGASTWLQFLGDGITAATWFVKHKNVERFKAYAEAIEAVNRAFDSLEAVAAEEKAA